MIEEMTETIISFQRVVPGAKERLVQITGNARSQSMKCSFLQGKVSQICKKLSQTSARKIDINIRISVKGSVLGFMF